MNGQRPDYVLRACSRTHLLAYRLAELDAMMLVARELLGSKATILQSHMRGRLVRQALAP